MAAIGGGVGAGLGNLAKGSGFISKALDISVVRGVSGSVLGQGIGVLTGLQTEFDWTGVVAAGVSSFAVGQFGGTSTAAQSAVSALANAATRSLMDGTNFGDNIIAALPDVIGQTIGNAIARGFSKKDGGGFSFNLGSTISETFGLLTDLPAGIVDGLMDMQDRVQANMAAMGANVVIGAAANRTTFQNEQDAKLAADLQARFDQVVTTGMRNIGQQYAQQVAFSANLQQRFNNVPDHLAIVQSITARETTRSHRENAADMIKANAKLGRWGQSVDYANGVDMTKFGTPMTLDTIQTGLDVVGLAPGVGIFADVANTAISLARGNYGAAALSAAAIVPIIGQAATSAKFAATAAKAAKYSDEVVDGIKAAKYSDEVVDGIKAVNIATGGFEAITKANLYKADGVQGIYEFVTKDGIKYVGQSNDIGRRLAEHGFASADGRIADGVQILFKEIDPDMIAGLDAKFVREIAEQAHIEKLLGGDRVQRGVTTKILENKVNPIGKARLDTYNQYKHLFQ